MNKDEALTMAIVTLEAFEITGYCDETIQACKEALEQPAYETESWKNNMKEAEKILAKAKFANEQPAQKSMACDGKFPENFDASLNIPAQYLRLANGIMMDYMGKRSWDVPMCATEIMEFINTHLAPSWQGLSDDEMKQLEIDPEEYYKINIALKEKNHG